MGAQFLNDPDDVRWCVDVHAKNFAGQFRSFVITGNEDCPETLELFASLEPTVDETPTAILHPSADA